MKKLLLIAFTLTAVLSTNAASKIAGYWNFNSITNDAKTSTGVTTASKGTGVASPVGGTSFTYASGFGKDPDSSGGDNSGINFSTFADSAKNSATAGAQFKTSSKGVKNLLMTWVQRHSNTCSKYAQLFYGTDGINWTVYKGAGTDTADLYYAKNGGDKWYVRSADFTGLGLDDKDSIFIKLVSVFDPNGNSTYTAATSSVLYKKTGTWRFDIVAITGDSITGTSTSTAPGAFSLLSPANKSSITVKKGDTTNFITKWNSSKGANKYEFNLYYPIAPNTSIFPVPSDNGGLDTTFTLNSGDVWDQLKTLGVKEGGSITLLWNVIAEDTLSGKTTASTQKFEITINRAVFSTTTAGTGAFSLISPKDKASITVKSKDTANFIIKWNKSKGSQTYAFNLYSPLAPSTSLLTLASDNKGLDTTFKLNSGYVWDALKSFVAEGKSITLLWNVVATDSVNKKTTASTEKFELTITRAVFVGIEDNNISNAKFNVYPNPVNGVVNFSNLIAGSTLSIVDASGKTVIPAQIVNGTTLSLNLTIQSGLYFVRTLSGNQISTQKLIVR